MERLTRKVGGTHGTVNMYRLSRPLYLVGVPLVSKRQVPHLGAGPP